MGFLFESSAGVLHWHERCPKWPSRFSTSYRSSNTCIENIADLRDPTSPPIKKARTLVVTENAKLRKFVPHYFLVLLMYEKRWKDACQSAFLSWNRRSYTPNGWFTIPLNQKTNFDSEVNGLKNGKMSMVYYRGNQINVFLSRKKT